MDFNGLHLLFFSIDGAIRCRSSTYFLELPLILTLSCAQEIKLLFILALKHSSRYICLRRHKELIKSFQLMFAYWFL